MVDQVPPVASLGVLAAKAFQFCSHSKSWIHLRAINKMAEQFATNPFFFSEAWEKLVLLEPQVWGL